jgi:diguanylate cyclase (GGDEF)-like protein
MNLSRSSRDLWATLLPTMGALLALIIASRVAALGDLEALGGSYGELVGAWWLAALLAAGVAAAFHRPFGATTLGLGTAVIAPAVLLFGVVPAAGLAASCLLLAELGWRSVRGSGPEPLPERRRLLGAVEAAGRTALAALAAGIAWAALPRWRLDPGIAARAALAAVVYLLVWIGLDFAERKIRRPEQGYRRRWISPLAADLVGWAAGAGLALAGAAGQVAADGGAGSGVGLAGVGVRSAHAVAGTGGGNGWRTAGLLLALFAVLSLEAGRNGLLLEKARNRVRNLERLGRAGKRMVSRAQEEMAGVAERIYLECYKVVHCLWFQFETLTPGSEFKSWWSGPAGVVFEGVPEPEPHPPALPGFHRRPQWQIVERQLRVDGKVMARLRLWCDPRLLDPQQVELVDRLLPQMSASVQRCLLDRESREDPLTGLATRRVLEKRLHAVHARAIEEGGTMAIVLCDLDHFKRINDTHGHGAGDAALVAVAGVLREERRESDLCCRYGGEEFLLLLDGTGGESALAFAERIRRRIEELVVEVDGRPIPLTLSAGAAAFPELYIKTAAELILFADEALYEAKRQGRNRCLLDLGQGRYREISGAIHAAEDAPAVREPPRIFA